MKSSPGPSECRWAGGGLFDVLAGGQQIGQADLPFEPHLGRTGRGGACRHRSSASACPPGRTRRPDWPAPWSCRRPARGWRRPAAPSPDRENARLVRSVRKASLAAASGATCACTLSRPDGVQLVHLADHRQQRRAELQSAFPRASGSDRRECRGRRSGPSPIPRPAIRLHRPMSDSLGQTGVLGSIGSLTTAVRMSPWSCRRSTLAILFEQHVAQIAEEFQIVLQQFEPFALADQGHGFGRGLVRSWPAARPRDDRLSSSRCRTICISIGPSCCWRISPSRCVDLSW